MKISSSLFALVFCFVSLNSAQALSQKLAKIGSPTRAIQDLDGMLDEFKKGKNLSKTDEEFNRKLKKKILHGTFDVRALSQLALSKHWTERKRSEQDKFVDLMVALLEEKALFSHEQSAAKSKQGGKYMVSYVSERFLDEQKAHAFVHTKVSVPSEKVTIHLNYRLKKQGDEWKIYDIIVDEASLVSNYRYQFNSIITKNGYDHLVGLMSKKLDELKAKRAKTS